MTDSDTLKKINQLENLVHLLEEFYHLSVYE
jgi:hypothetical protein